MNNSNESKAKVFFELGRAVTRFVQKRDRYEYRMVCKFAFSLKLEVPNFDELFKGLISSESPTAKWFAENDKFENYYQIGVYAESLFASYLFFLRGRDFESINSTVERLMDLCSREDIPREILDDYVTGMKNAFSVPKEKEEEIYADAAAVGISIKADDQILMGNMRETGDAKAVYSRFVQNFSKALLDNEDTEPNELLEFERIDSAPSSFPKDVLDALNLTIDEVSVCYKHECNLATIGLCGKIVETLLSTAYEVVTGDDPGTRGHSALRTALKNRGMPLEGSLDKMLEYINACRNKAVHGNVIIPTKKEATAVGIFTQDVIDRIFRYFDTLNTT